MCTKHLSTNLLPKDSHLWLSLEKIIFDTFIAYGFKNIRTPVVEKTDTFCRAIGQTTDSLCYDYIS
jgi:histidyl-tRNA synthetase